MRYISEEPHSSNTLPNGWTQHYDSASGKFYYYDPYTQNYFLYHGGMKYTTLLSDDT